MTTLRDALAPAADSRDDTTGVVSYVYTTADGSLDGRVDVDLGGGQVAKAIRVLASSWTPELRRTVALMRYPDGQRIVLGPVRTSNPTPPVAVSLMFPYEVTEPVPAVANPYVVNVSATGSWRPADGWAGGYMPATDAVAQGASSASSSFYKGCYFYGDGAFSVLRGRRCAWMTVRVHRLGVGGTSAATQQVLALHAHANRPDGEPLFVTGAENLGALTWNGVQTFSAPAWWGDWLINGQAFGVGHLLMAYGYGNQSYAAGKSADGFTGQVSIGWS